MMQTYRKIFDLLDRRERRGFMLLLIMVLVMGLLDVAGVASILPFLSVLANPHNIHESTYLSAIYQNLGFEQEREFLLFLGGIVFVLVVCGLAFKALTLYALTRFSTMRNYSIASRLLRGYLSQPYVWFLNRHSADLGKSILSEVHEVVKTTILPAMNLLANAVVLLFLTLLVFLVDPVTMAIAMALLGGSYLMIFMSVRRLLARIGAQRVLANRERYQLAGEAFSGFKNVKLMGLERSYLKRFRKPAEVFARTQAASSIIGLVPRFILEAVAFGGMLVFLLALLVLRDGRIEDALPILGLFAFAGIRMFPAMQKVYYDFTKLQFGRYALDALHKDVMASRNSVSDGEALAVEPIGLHHDLELDAVQFSYPGSHRVALDRLSFTLRAHTTVGLVGGSGAGKTTAVDVILGLVSPQQGALRVDGQEITEQNCRAWQRSVGYVPQNIFLADDTIAANIALGIPPGAVDASAVERAAGIAELHRFVVEELPDGYDTVVGEHGVRLSGGQRQRIGIARALYHDPAVLVLDEATSALDNRTERAVMDAVRTLAGAKTIIVVAHRLSTVEHCTEIVLLEAGRVAARGPYLELLRTSARFRDLVEAAA